MRKRMAATLALLAGLGGGLAALVAGIGGQVPAAAAPAAGIGPAQAREIGLVRAAAAGDAEPLVAVESDDVSEAAASMATPQGPPLSEVQGGVYVVDMRGQFTLGQAHTPRWASAPTGTVMKVAITRSGFVLGIHLGEQ
jgi:hypothetical protein